MDKKAADLIMEVASDAGFEFDQRDDYSGRGMYGSKTSANRIAEEDDIGAGRDYSLEDFITDLRSLRQDSMGRGSIFY